MQILFDILRSDYYRRQQQLQSILKLNQSLMPRMLWIGCSDIYLSPYLATGMQPGEIILHQNIANQVKTDDVNVQSIIQYAVEKCEVSTIVVCGHYQCMSVQSALKEAEGISSDPAPMHTWMQDLRELAARHWSSLRSIPTFKGRTHRLSELNVLMQTERLRHNIFVKASKQLVQISPWMFDSEKGAFITLFSNQIEQNQLLTK